MLEGARPWICAAAAVGPPVAALALGSDGPTAPAVAAAALLLAGGASFWLPALVALPAFQFLPAGPPPELTAAMEAAGVSGWGAIAADPAALWVEMRGLAWCVAAFALARTAAASRQAVWWTAAAIAAFGCFEGALGLAPQPGTGPASGSIVHRGQYAALLELTFGAGCGLTAASWAGRSWRERMEDRALLGGVVGLAAAALSLGGIAMSLSRTGIVAGALAALAAVVWFGGRTSWVAPAGAVLLAGLVWMAPRALDRFEELAASGDPGRTAVWIDSVQLVQDHWLTGVGMGSFPAAFRRSSFYLPRKGVDNAHSDYLEWIVELGAPAAFVLFGAILAALRAVNLRDPLAAGCAIGAGAALLHATVDLPLQSPGIAALAAAMLGLASQPAPAGGRASAVLVGLAILALASTKVDAPVDFYLAAGRAQAQGDAAEAERLYRAALERNLLTAPAWLRLAELERARGRLDLALLYARTAREVEPFTLRTEWPLAELELAAGLEETATGRLAGLVAAAPDLLDAALLTASRSGVEPARLETLAPANNPEAAGRLLAFLVRSGRAERLPEAHARLGSPELPQQYRDWLLREAGYRP